MSRKPPTLNQYLRQEFLFEIDGKEVKMTREKYFEIKGRKPDGVLPEYDQSLFKILQEHGGYRPCIIRLALAYRNLLFMQKHWL